ncbi:hypothetical protein [Granulicatella adiacens]
MKKKTVIIGSTLLLLVLGGVSALNVINPSWRENTIFATARDKQLAYLKAHENEIVAWIHSVYPKVETVQFDWDTLTVGPVSNGVMNVGYNLSVRAKFNNMLETVLYIDFKIDNKDSIPSISKMGMNNPPLIKSDGVWKPYE